MIEMAANLAGVAWMAREAVTGVKQPLLSFGEFGGFYAGEVLLIADSLLVVGLFYARRGRIEARAMPLLHLVTATFLVGLGLATASNQTVHGRIFSYHALWHIVGAFGFVLLGAFNHARRHPATPASADRPG